LGCGAGGDVYLLIAKIRSLSRKDISDIAAFVRKTNIPKLDLIQDRLAKVQAHGYLHTPVQTSLGVVSQKQVPVVVLPEETLACLERPSGEVLEHLLDKRKLTDENIERWEIGWNPHVDRIGIPIRNRAGELVGLSGRAFYSTQKPKYLHSKGFRRDAVLYGEHFVEPSTIGYLTEGFFDVHTLTQHGYKNVVAMCGSYLSSDQESKLATWFEEVVVVPDGDEAGYAAAKKIKESLSKRVRCKVADVPRGFDPGEFTPEMSLNLLGTPS
jgi:hypothetical protein